MLVLYCIVLITQAWLASVCTQPKSWGCTGNCLCRKLSCCVPIIVFLPPPPVIGCRFLLKTEYKGTAMKLWQICHRAKILVPRHARRRHNRHIPMENTHKWVTTMWLPSDSGSTVAMATRVSMIPIPALWLGVNSTYITQDTMGTRELQVDNVRDMLCLFYQPSLSSNFACVSVYLLCLFLDIQLKMFLTYCLLGTKTLFFCFLFLCLKWRVLMNI